MFDWWIELGEPDGFVQVKIECLRIWSQPGVLYSQEETYLYINPWSQNVGRMNQRVQQFLIHCCSES